MKESNLPKSPTDWTLPPVRKFKAFSLYSRLDLDLVSSASFGPTHFLLKGVKLEVEWVFLAGLRRMRRVCFDPDKS